MQASFCFIGFLTMNVPRCSHFLSTAEFKKIRIVRILPKFWVVFYWAVCVGERGAFCMDVQFIARRTKAIQRDNFSGIDGFFCFFVVSLDKNDQEETVFQKLLPF